MNPTLALAIGAALYALLSEWLGESPAVPFNSVFGALLAGLRWCHRRYHRDPEALTQRSMVAVDDQIERFHRDSQIQEFQRDLAQAQLQREELLKDPDVRDVQIRLVNNRVALVVDYASIAEQTGESLKLGGPMRITSPLTLTQESGLLERS